MADPTKELDRLRPFKRINNQKAIPGGSPDGFGVASGCHLPDELGKDDKAIEEEFRKFLLRRPGALGEIARAIEVAKQVAQVVQQVTAIAQRLAALLGPLALALGAAGGPIGAVIAALALVANALNFVSSIVNGFLSAIDTALNAFMVRIGAALARRAIRRIPQWVPVEDAGNRDKITAAQVREVEGIVARSYCDPLGTPFCGGETARHHPARCGGETESPAQVR